MGAAGTDAAPETADVVLMTDDRRVVRETIVIGRRALATIRQNLWFTAATSRPTSCSRCRDGFRRSARPLRGPFLTWP